MDVLPLSPLSCLTLTPLSPLPSPPSPLSPVQTLTALEGLGQEALASLREQLLSETIDFRAVQIDPAPFQLVERTDLYKVSLLPSTLLASSYISLLYSPSSRRFTACSPYWPCLMPMLQALED